MLELEENLTVPRLYFFDLGKAEGEILEIEGARSLRLDHQISQSILAGLP